MEEAKFLTLDEFESYGGGTLDVEEFENLLTQAEQLLNVETDGFYMTAEALNNDTVVFRRTRYKQALAQQIRAFVDSKATTLAQQAAKPVQQSIGDTSVSYGDNRRTGTDNKPKTLVAPESIALLSSTGLLYRGAKLWTHC